MKKNACTYTFTSLKLNNIDSHCIFDDKVPNDTCDDLSLFISHKH